MCARTFQRGRGSPWWDGLMAASTQQRTARAYAWGSGSRSAPAGRGPRLATVVIVEVALVLALFVVYQLVRWLAIDDAGVAFANARRIVEWERDAGIFIERSLQRSVIEVDHLRRFLAAYYVWALYPLMIVLAGVTFATKRELYRWARRAIFLSWGIALAGYVLFPVAPPRLLWEQGFVDVVYEGTNGMPFWVNSYAAMPSMHQGFALIFGVTLYRLLTPWIGLPAALALPGLMFLSIVGTANHFVLDAVAGLGVATLGMVAASLVVRRPLRARRRGAEAPASAA